MRHGNKPRCFRHDSPAAERSESERVQTSEIVKACGDPEDDRILELAVNGYADFVITGDADLLAMDPFRGTRIVTPADFLHAGD